MHLGLFISMRNKSQILTKCIWTSGQTFRGKGTCSRVRMSEGIELRVLPPALYPTPR